jgi:hypothetical protein
MTTKTRPARTVLRLPLTCVAVLLTATLLAGCTSKTEFGACIGLADDKDPALIYKVSKWNLFLAILGIEMIIPPIWVAVNQTYCPVGRR